MVVKRQRTGAGARISADHIVVYRLISIGVIAAAAAGIVTSWHGLVFVAEWQSLEEPLRWVTPVMVDVPIVVLTLGVLAKRSRGESTWLFRTLSLLLVAVSAAANFSYSVSRRGLDSFDDWVGACLNALAPALVLLTTEVLGSLVTRPKRPRRSQRRRRRTKPLQAATFSSPSPTGSDRAGS